MMSKAETLIKNAGLRPTKARIAVLTVITEAATALSHHDILQQLDRNEDHQAFDRVTIYRVLDWLHDNQLTHKIVTDDRSWKFQANTPVTKNHYKPASAKQLFDNGHAHAHLQCEKCQSVICIHESEASIPEQLIKQYQISSIEVNLKGICKQCAK